MLFENLLFRVEKAMLTKDYSNCFISQQLLFKHRSGYTVMTTRTEKLK